MQKIEREEHADDVEPFQRGHAGAIALCQNEF